ncbi:MAG TPA: MarR family transcriptional regulator [Sphingomonas sp.]
MQLNRVSIARIDRQSPPVQAGKMNYVDTSRHAVDEDLGGIDEILGFHIRLAHGAVYRHFTSTFSDLDLTQKQVSVLWLIDDHPDIVQADIGRRLQMDRATVMAIVNRLEKRGFIERGAPQSDRRRQTLHMTEAGHDALLAARECILEHEQWLKGRFSRGETTMLIELLRRIHQ